MDPSAQAEDEARRLRLARWLVGMLVVAVGAATVLRPLLVPLDPLFTWIGGLNTILAGACWLAMGRPEAHRHGPTLLVVLVMAMLLPCLAISGGVNSQFAVLVPLIPICCLLVAGRTAALATVPVLAGLAILDVTTGGLGADLTNEVRDTGKTVSRAMWLVLSMGIGAALAIQVDRSLVRMQKKLQLQALQDPLTGAANRRALEDALDRDLAKAQRNGQPLSVLLVDVDHFKRLNDRLGHAVGDSALKQVVDAMHTCTRAGQDLVARYGGEEFVVLLSDTSATGALLVAEKIRVTIAGTLLDGDAAPAGTLTVTIGCATSTKAEPLTAESLLKVADDNLYRGKAGGRNQVVPVVPSVPMLAEKVDPSIPGAQPA